MLSATLFVCHIGKNDLVAALSFRSIERLVSNDNQVMNLRRFRAGFYAEVEG